MSVAENLNFLTSSFILNDRSIVLKSTVSLLSSEAKKLPRVRANLLLLRLARLTVSFELDGSDDSVMLVASKLDLFYLTLTFLRRGEGCRVSFDAIE